MSERDAWLQELWGTCQELPAHEREAKRAADRVVQRDLELRQIESVDALVLPYPEAGDAA